MSVINNTVYDTIVEEFKNLVSNSKLFEQKIIKIFVKQTGVGKSRMQGHEMIFLTKEYFPNLKFIFRLSPTLEVANDESFDHVEEFEDLRVRTINLEYYKNFDALGELRNDTVYVISMTHTLFSHRYEELKQYAKESVLCVEEAHQFTGCGDKGPEAYELVTGYSSNYDAKTIDRIYDWIGINGRVFGFTATTTKHHDGDEKLSNKFVICSELAPRKDLINSQAWVNNVTPYNFIKRNSHESVIDHVDSSIDSLLKREAELTLLREKDSNINTKLCAIYMCGQGKGVWGTPIHHNDHHTTGMVEIITDILLERGYPSDQKLIATVQDENRGGIQVWDLEGNCESLDKNKGVQELRLRMQDQKDPLRHLIGIQRLRSGINISNLGALVVGVVRAPKEIRTYIALQVFGRLVRTNVGTGSLIRDKYGNNITRYLNEYPIDFDVDIDTIIETIKVANHFDIWYPIGISTKGKIIAEDVWGEAIKEHKESYANSLDDGIDYLYNVIDKPRPSKVLSVSNNENEVICPHCGEPVFPKIHDNGRVTLDRFFHIGCNE